MIFFEHTDPDYFDKKITIKWRKIQKNNNEEHTHTVTEKAILIIVKIFCLKNKME